MESTMQNAMNTVDTAMYTLRRLSTLCHVLVEFENNPMSDTIALSEMGSVMALIRDSLDEQVTALDSIQWFPRKVAAV